MKLIVMRHGTCKGLDRSIINGWLDFPLTADGICEAKSVAKFLKEYTFDEAYTSYLSRAYDTAKLVMEKLGSKCEVIRDISLNERHYGAFQGMEREEAYKYPEYNTLSLSADRLDNRLIPLSDENYSRQLEEYSIKLGVDKDNLCLPKSESILDVEERVNEFLDNKIFLPENENKTILIVSHANVVKLITKRVENLTYDQTTKLRFATCGMKIFDIQNINSNMVVKNVININKEWVE